MDPSFQPFDQFVPPPFTGKSKSWTHTVSITAFPVEQPIGSASKSPSVRNKRQPPSSPRAGWKSPKQLEEDASSRSSKTFFFFASLLLAHAGLLSSTSISTRSEKGGRCSRRDAYFC
jgi:hypothetical protein